MVRIEGEIVIDRPVEEVFDFVADERNEPRYNPRMVRAEQITPEPIGVGTRFEAEIRSMGRPAGMTIENTGYERPRRLASRTRMRTHGHRGGPAVRSGGRPDADAMALGVEAAGRSQADLPPGRTYGAAPGAGDLDQPQAPPGSASGFVASRHLTTRALGTSRSRWAARLGSKRRRKARAARSSSSREGAARRRNGECCTAASATSAAPSPVMNDDDRRRPGDRRRCLPAGPARSRGVSNRAGDGGPGGSRGAHRRAVHP
jgi:uncharacterized protein YndB with AHSA1/START domain